MNQSLFRNFEATTQRAGIAAAQGRQDDAEEHYKQALSQYNAIKDSPIEHSRKVSAYNELLTIYEQLNTAGFVGGKNASSVRIGRNIGLIVPGRKLSESRTEHGAQQKNREQNNRSRMSFPAFAGLFLAVILATTLVSKPATLGFAVLEGNLGDTNSGNIKYTGSASIDVQKLTIISLKTLFSDSAKHSLTFSATQPNGVFVDVANGILAITPAPGYHGTAIMTIVASDGENVLRVPIAVQVN